MGKSESVLVCLHSNKLWYAGAMLTVGLTSCLFVFAHMSKLDYIPNLNLFFVELELT